MAQDFHASYAKTYDRLQPLKKEMYHFYQQLALDFVGFDKQDRFRMLDLGCGTGTFLNAILERIRECPCVAVDYSPEMLDVARAKTAGLSGSRRAPAGRPEPGAPGRSRQVRPWSQRSQPSTNLTDPNKARLLESVYEALAPDGWFSSSTHERDVRRRRVQAGRRRARLRMEHRFTDAGADIGESDELEAIGDDDAPTPTVSRRFRTTWSG